MAVKPFTPGEVPGQSHRLCSSHLSSIDGWRAVSIILVLGGHCRCAIGFPPKWTSAFAWLFDADLGVRFFFVISGFLITYLLVQERQRKGDVSLKKFYIRRALRILPVYYAFMMFVVGLALFSKFRQSPSAWIGNWTFTTDFLPGSLTTGHLWSLSVEQQFYLLWPTLFALAWRRGWRCFPYCAAALPLVIAPVCRIMAYKLLYPAFLGPFFEVYSFFAYFDSIAVGCLAALLLTADTEQFSALLLRHRRVLLCSAVLLLAAPFVLERLSLLSALTVPLGRAVQAAGIGVLLLLSILMPEKFRFLNWPFMQWIGVLSYSIYIWQEIFCVDPATFGWPNMFWMSFPWWPLAAVGVAAVSYYGLEKPVLKLRAGFRT
jgi:peptidoglycan/LPS O-acetylase OafA/YrhL